MPPLLTSRSIHYPLYFPQYSLSSSLPAVFIVLLTSRNIHCPLPHQTETAECPHQLLTALYCCTDWLRQASHWERSLGRMERRNIKPGQGPTQTNWRPQPAKHRLMCGLQQAACVHTGTVQPQAAYTPMECTQSPCAVRMNQTATQAVGMAFRASRPGPNIKGSYILSQRLCCTREICL